MESCKHNGGYVNNISPPICTNRFIFGKWTFFILFFHDMPTNPIISQIQFFVMSSLVFSIKQAATLLSCHF